tara:strand:- start:146 stop:1975 length:1830 start_codon:yes stop_codon:yes gene_type:complete
MDHNKEIFIDDKGHIRSNEFEDIYFSIDNGLGESIHNFFDGNNLPNAWVGKDNFTIVELGFGTGMNMMLAVKYFLENENHPKHLDLISIEKFPLSKNVIRKALEPFKKELGEAFDLILDAYPDHAIPGFHYLEILPNVNLLLIFDDVEEALNKVSANVDCWFLDGFNPAKNQSMWSGAVFQKMADLSALSASFATFTAAGFVRRGLQDVGFECTKEKGFGRKRERLIGCFKVESPNKKTSVYPNPSTQKIAIIGAGIAGATCAYELSKAGFDITIFEKAADIASGASGNDLGLINPKLMAVQSPKSDFYTTAYLYALNFYKALQDIVDIGFDQRGSLHIGTDEKKVEKFHKMIEAANWPQSALEIIDSSDKINFLNNKKALWMPLSAVIEPYKAVKALVNLAVENGAKLELNQDVHDIKLENDAYNIITEQDDFDSFDKVILCNALSAKKIDLVKDLILKPVRGQITKAKSKDNYFKLDQNLCFGGYLSQLKEDEFILGATYDRGDADDEHRAEDDLSNVDYLTRNFPELKDKFDIQTGRAGIRVSSEDYSPYVGGYNGADGSRIYLSLAHRSHGLTSSPISAKIILNSIMGYSKPIDKMAWDCIDPMR